MRKWLHPHNIVGFGLITIAGLGAAFGHAPSAQGSEQPVESFTTPEQLAAKEAAVTQCIMEQKVPVMGFNMKVVCLKPDQIAWVR
jgi:hypothetical protein